jgi:hypothetical protein
MSDSSRRRLDRIERAIEGLIDGHDGLTRSQQQLLTAQVLLTQAQQQTEKRIAALADGADKQFTALAEAQRNTEERLSVLIRMMDEWIGRNPRQS